MSLANRTPRPDPSKAGAAREGVRPPFNAPSRLSFAHVGGSVVWQTYPGHAWLSIEQAEEVLALVLEEWTRARMSGGGPCSAISMAEELTAAIKAARDWRKAGVV